MEGSFRGVDILLFGYIVPPSKMGSKRTGRTRAQVMYDLASFFHALDNAECSRYIQAKEIPRKFLACMVCSNEYRQQIQKMYDDA